MVYPLSGTTGPYTASPSHALALLALGRLTHTDPYRQTHNKTALKVPIRLRQKSTLVPGVVVALQPWRCQKQPWTNKTALNLGKTISGDPGNLLS